MGFKENLRAELNYSGMLIKELAALSGVSQHALNNYLNKRGQIPSLEAGIKIAKALGVSAEYLVFGEENEPKNVELHSELRAITRLAKQLRKKERRFILEMLKWMSARADIEL